MALQEFSGFTILLNQAPSVLNSALVGCDVPAAAGIREIKTSRNFITYIIMLDNPIARPMRDRWLQ